MTQQVEVTQALSERAPETMAFDKISRRETVMQKLFDGPCPICRGIEGCSHTVSERAQAYAKFATALAEAEARGRAMGIDEAAKVADTYTWNASSTPFVDRNRIAAAIRNLKTEGTSDDQ